MKMTDELLDDVIAKYGSYNTITEENLDEYHDELFIKIKKQMQEGKYIQFLKVVFGMGFYLTIVID